MSIVRAYGNGAVPHTHSRSNTDERSERTKIMLKRRLQTVSAAVVIGVAALGAGPLHANLITGTISNWSAASGLIRIGDGTNHVSMDWSWRSPDQAWFYGSSFTGDSDVAILSGVTDVRQITDASTLPFSSGSVLADTGQFVAWKNVALGSESVYGVLRLDELASSSLSPTDQFLSGTWWFQTDGTGNFNDTIIPVPGAVGLGVIGLSMAGWRLRRKTR